MLWVSPGILTNKKLKVGRYVRRDQVPERCIREWMNDTERYSKDQELKAPAQQRVAQASIIHFCIIFLHKPDERTDWFMDNAIDQCSATHPTVHPALDSCSYVHKAQKFMQKAKRLVCHYVHALQCTILRPCRRCTLGSNRKSKILRDCGTPDSMMTKHLKWMW